jgi:hypothetical protein
LAAVAWCAGAAAATPPTAAMSAMKATIMAADGLTLPLNHFMDILLPRILVGVDRT